MQVEQLHPVYQAAQRTQAKACMITAIDGLTGDTVEGCMVPKFKEPPHIDYPDCASPGLAEIVQEYKKLFKSIFGQQMWHNISLPP